MAFIKYKWLPVFDTQNCSGCRACSPTCISGALSVVEGVINFNPSICLSHGRCVEQCPIGGIHMEWVPFLGDSRHGLIRTGLPKAV